MTAISGRRESFVCWCSASFLSSSLFTSHIVAYFPPSLWLSEDVKLSAWKYINWYQRLWEAFILYTNYTFDFSYDKPLGGKSVFSKLDFSVWQTETSHSRKYLPGCCCTVFRPVHVIFNSREQGSCLVLFTIVSSLIQGFPTLSLLKFWTQ